MRVTQHHQVRARHLWMVRHGGVELPLEVDDFLVALHQRGDHDVAALRHREVVGGGVASGDPHGRCGPLHRLGHTGRCRELPDLAVVGVVALPERPDGRHEFTQVLSAVGGRHSVCQPVELELVGAPGESHSIRPLLMTSSSAHSPAALSGCQNGAMMVPAPRRMVEVFAARWASSGIGLGEIVYSIAWCSPIHTVLNPPASAIRASSERFSKSCRWLTSSSQRSMCTNSENLMTASPLLLWRRPSR